MKVQDIIRIQAVTIGFAAALLFASAAPAQEITNTEFPDQNTQTVQAVPNPASDAATAGVSGANAAANEAVATQEAAVAQASVMNSWLVTLMIIFVGGGTLYSLTGLRRSGRNRYAKAAHAVRSVTLSS